MKEMVEIFISSALINLFRAQPDLSVFEPRDTSEREPNLSFHLANELWKYIFWLNCDFDVIKKPPHGNKRPDIIFHKRGVSALNFLVVEVKRASNPEGVGKDLNKIREEWFSGNLCYKFGASVLIDEEEGNFAIRLLKCDNPQVETIITSGAPPTYLELPKIARVRRNSIFELVRSIAEAEREGDEGEVASGLPELYRLIEKVYT